MGSKLIMAFDGGGVLGIGPATYLSLMESEEKCPALSILAGTSAGSILAAARACGLSWNSVLCQFRKGAPEIFEKAPWTWRMDPRKPKYDGKGLIRVLKSVFGNTQMNQTIYPLFIVAMDYSRGAPKVFDSTDSTPVWEAVAASCSAPTYFPPMPGGLVDGGLVANDPSAVAIVGAVSKLGVDLDNLWCISFGTNGDYWKDPKIGVNTNKLQWAELLLNNPTRGNEELGGFQARTITRGRYFRVEPILSDTYSLDSIDKMDEYARIWAGLYTAKGHELQNFIRRIP